VKSSEDNAETTRYKTVVMTDRRQKCQQLQLHEGH